MWRGALLKRDEFDAEVAELVVERFPIGDEIVVGLRLFRRLEVGLRPLVDGDFGVLALGETLAVLFYRRDPFEFKSLPRCGCELSCILLLIRATCA